MNLWPHQQFALDEVPRLIGLGERKLLVTSPTGGGKTRVICGLIQWGLENGLPAILYTNRKMLIEQLSDVLSGHGIRFGVRAANHQDQRELPVQISSLPTERQRVLKSEKWQVHGHGDKTLAIVDEAHLNAASTAQAILAKHNEHGGTYVGFTATPIGLGHLYSKLVVAGTPSELRKCGALVPAYHYGPDEPDMRGFKANVQTGDYSEGDIRKAVMTKCIFARVLDWYRILNPEQRPSILFAPGVGESIWFTEQFNKAGIHWAHMDGKQIWLDGELHDTSYDLRREAVRRLKCGDIKGISNRFVLREGIDIPEASHGIFATVMGGLQTWLQSAGRLLRACPGKGKATFQDHGGMWWRHGSANIDRDWHLNLTENIIKSMREDRLREKKDPEPIRCPSCGMIRASGLVCSQCGHVTTRKSRIVVQTDGKLHYHHGDIFKPRVVRTYHNTARLWQQMYHRARNSRNRMTFRQAEGLFFYENHYYPPRDLSFMPKDDFDWCLPVADVPKENLT